jgi:hypothetical protein
VLSLAVEDEGKAITRGSGWVHARGHAIMAMWERLAARAPGMTVAGEAATGHDAVRVAREARADVV